MVILLLLIGAFVLIAGAILAILTYLSDGEAGFAIAGVIGVVVGIFLMACGGHMDVLEQNQNTRTTECGSVRVIAPQNYEITCNKFHPIPH